MQTDRSALPQSPQEKTFPCALTEVEQARNWVAGIYAAAGLDTHTVRLLVSEVATNAVLYGGGPNFRVRVLPSGRIEIYDHSSREPEPQEAGPGDESGRGLVLLALLATGWETKREQDDAGKWVSFTPTRPLTEPDIRLA